MGEAGLTQGALILAGATCWGLVWLLSSELLLFTSFLLLEFFLVISKYHCQEVFCLNNWFLNNAVDHFHFLLSLLPSFKIALL